MDVRDLTGKVAMVTGAASGIGRATAIALAGRGADLAICDVDEGGLKETADRIESVRRRTVRARVDVAEAEQMERFAGEAWAELGRIDLIVNNAGIGVGGEFLEVPLEEWRRIVGINLMGVVHGCHAFVPRMVEAGRGGHVVNIASMAGYFSAPGMTSYHATKFGVIGFSESLRAELSRHGIGVTAICPGVINTPITRNTRMYGASATEENRQRGIQAFERRNYGPERVALGILKAVQRNRGVAPVSPEAWVAYYVKRFAPWLVAAIGSYSARRLAEESPGRP